MASGDGLAQGALAADVGVVGIAGAQAVDSCIDDRCRCVEIGIADRQQQDVIALFQASQGAVVDIPGGGAVAGDALGEL
ncbi:hypothetical protein D9M71_726860 [compost metagenome]